MRKQFILFVLFVLGFLSHTDSYSQLLSCNDKVFIPNVESHCIENPVVSSFTLAQVVGSNSTCLQSKGELYVYGFQAKATKLEVVIDAGKNLNEVLGVAILEFDCLSGTTTRVFYCEQKKAEHALKQLILRNIVLGSNYLLVINSPKRIDKVCLRNFPGLRDPGGDCKDALLLCDKSSFSVPSFNFSDKDRKELKDANCFSVTRDREVAWFKWVCDAPGSLTFTINPVSFEDDIDFVIYELTEGVNNCNDRVEKRCMASGLNDRPACGYVTGLSEFETDTSEPPGCPSGSNAFIKPLEMQAGKTYLLAVMNFSQSGAGFHISFGGTGTFLGPKLILDIMPDMPNCDEIIWIQDSVFSPFGPVLSKQFTLSEGAKLKTKPGMSPFLVEFDRYGYHEIYLEVETSEGCISSIKDTIFVDECCKTTGLTANITGYQPSLCHGDSTGQIRLSAQGGTNQYGYQYRRDSGMLTRQSQFKGLKTGEYVFSVYDDKGCQVSVDTLLTEPERFSVRAQMDRSEVELGETASVTLQYEPDTTTLRKLLLQGEEWDCRFYNCYGFVDTPYIDQGYRITAISREGCKSEYTIPITVISNRKFGAPNAMSRTADREENRYFTLYSSKLTKGMDLKIFDRWGTLVFAGNSLPLNEPGKGWDGYYRGQPCPVGVYLYQAVVTFVDNKTELLAGEIHVLE